MRLDKSQSVLQPKRSSKTLDSTKLNRKSAQRTAQDAAQGGRSSAGITSTAKAAGEEATQPELLWPVPLHERTPEQTALIALQGLLEAREAHIAHLEVRGTTSPKCAQ